MALGPAKTLATDKIKAVLDGTGLEVLKDFLLPVLEDDVVLRARFLKRFAADNASARDFYQEGNREFAKTRSEFGYGSTTYLDVLVDDVKKHEEAGNPAEATRMYQDIARAIVKNVDMLDNGEALEMEDFSDAVCGIARCMKRSAPHETKRPHISYMFNLLQDNPGYWDSCKNALTDMCTDREDLEFWNALLDQVMPAKLDEKSQGYYTDLENVSMRIAMLQKLDAVAAREVYERYQDNQYIRDKYKKHLK